MYTYDVFKFIDDENILQRIIILRNAARILREWEIEEKIQNYCYLLQYLGLPRRIIRGFSSDTENCVGCSSLCTQFSVWITAFSSAISNAVIHKMKDGRSVHEKLTPTMIER